MNCPRCNTELPDTATYCVQCGAPSHPASFSYLPEGTPPWPTSAPKNFSYMQETNVQPASSTYAEGTKPTSSRSGWSLRSSLVWNFVSYASRQAIPPVLQIPTQPTRPACKHSVNSRE